MHEHNYKIIHQWISIQLIPLLILTYKYVRITQRADWKKMFVTVNFKSWHVSIMHVLLRVGAATWRMSAATIFIALPLTHIRAHGAARETADLPANPICMRNKPLKTFLEVARKKATTYVLYRRLSRASNHENENVLASRLWLTLYVYERTCK